MHVDEALLGRVKAATRGDHGREQLADARIERYTRACKLSHGPCPQRSAYWEQRAQQCAEDLRRMILRPVKARVECAGK